MYTKLRSNKAFTLVEIMIVVAIIGLLVAIALPSFYKARENTRKGLCDNNLRLLGQAVEQEKIKQGIAEDADPAFDDATIGTYMKGGVIPACPSGGAYTLEAGVVTCSTDGHGTYNTRA